MLEQAQPAEKAGGDNARPSSAARCGRAQTDPSLPPWYCLLVSPKCERRVEAELARKVKAVYLPRYTVERIARRSRKAYIADLPLYPRYLFVQVDSASGWYGVLATKGVDDIVRAACEPLRVPHAVIEAIRRDEEMGLHDRYLPRRETWRAGEPVLIRSGVLDGLIGTILATTSGETARVLISIFGRETTLITPTRHLHRPRQRIAA